MEKTLKIHEFAPRWHILNVPERYGALYLHHVLLLLPVGSSRVCIDGPGNCGSFCEAVGGDLWGR